MPAVFRSGTEAADALLNEFTVHDFVRLLADEGPEFGRVTEVGSGGLTVQTFDGSLTCDESDAERADPTEIPAFVLYELCSDEELESLDLDPEMAEEFGLSRMVRGRERPRTTIGRPDPERSMATKLAQREPMTRNKKSRSMKGVWRRKKSRSAPAPDPAFGLRGFESLEGFERLVEQGLPPGQPKAGAGAVGLDGPNKTDDVKFGQEDKKFEKTSTVTPQKAYLQTQQVFEAANQFMRSLSLSKGMTYFQWIHDDPERGVVRVKINGLASKEIIEKFVKGLEDIEVRLLEKPKGSEETKDLQGNWVFETILPGFEESEEPWDKEPKDDVVPVSRGQAPGEIVIPEEPVGSEMGL